MHNRQTDPGFSGRAQNNQTAARVIGRGVRGLYVQANRAVRGIFVKVAFSWKMGQNGTNADQNQTRNRKQQEEAEKREQEGRASCLWI